MPTPARIALALLLAGTAAAGAQSFALSASGGDPEYDGRFRFVRLRWLSGGGPGAARDFRDSLYSRGWANAWNHDYPRAEQHLAQIIDELTGIDIITGGSRIMTLDDPALFHYPVAFMWEPGFWNLSDR